MRRSVFLVLLVAACGSKSPASPDAPIDTNLADSSPDGPPPGIELSGGANGLLWNAATSTLYLTDNNADALLKWTDANGIETVGSFPTGGPISLGDMVMRNGGTILTPNFGGGSGGIGNIFSMTSNGTGGSLSGLDPARRRIGFSQDSANKMYVGYFTGSGMNPTGGVATLTLATGQVGTETEIAGAVNNAGFKKLVGLVATTDAVYVSDQTVTTIYKIAIPGNTVTTLASGLPSADLLIQMPNGDLLTSGNGVHRIALDGTVTPNIFTGFEQVHGMAYDAVGHRLFLIEHSATAGTKDKLHIRTLAN